MSKFCVFCGKPPVDKNREHIIPQWLIKHTGRGKMPMELSCREKRKIIINEIARFLSFLILATWLFGNRKKD